jgi:hypothetical protein
MGIGVGAGRLRSAPTTNPLLFLAQQLYRLEVEGDHSTGVTVA